MTKNYKIWMDIVVVTFTHNPITWEVEAGGSRSFEFSKGYRMKPYLKEKN